MSAGNSTEPLVSAEQSILLPLSLLFLLLCLIFTALTVVQYFNGVAIAGKFLANCGIGLTAACSALWLARKEHFKQAAGILMLTILMLVVYTSLFLGLGIKAPVAINLTLIVLIASVCLDKRWGLRVMIGNCLLLLALFLTESLGWFSGMEEKSFSPSINTTIQLVSLYAFSYLIGGALQKRNERALEIVEGHNLALEKALNEKSRANQAKDSFLNMMSHEIRTPMAGIKTAIELLKDPRTPAHKRERYLKAIDTSTASLLNLLNDMLNTTQMESGEISVVENTFCVGDLMHDTANLFALAAQQKRLTLSVDSDEELNMQVMGDSARLRQMLSNLLGNAVKYTPSGHIQLCATKQELPSQSDLWTFMVSDTGPGISKQDQERLFSSHTRLQNATDSNEEGSGLGLSIVKRLAQALGGDVGVSSQLGVGSKFWFQIPLKRNQT